MGINIFKYDMHALKIKLIKNALKSNKKNLVSELRKYPFKPKKGFRRIDNLPNSLLIEEIIVIAKDYPEISNLILKSWYESESNLRETVVEELEKLGYKVEPLQFDEQGINWKCLKESDLLVDNSTTYFAPNRKIIENFDPTDITLMSIMNGWFNNECKNELNFSEVIENNLYNKNSQIRTFTDDIKNVSQGILEHKVSEQKNEITKDHESKEGVGSIVEIENKEESNSVKYDNKKLTITDDFSLLEKLMLKYEESKKIFLDILSNIYKNTEQDLFSDEHIYDSELHKDLQKN